MNWDTARAWLRHYWYAPLLAVGVFLVLMLASGLKAKFLDVWISRMLKRHDRATQAAWREIEERQEQRIRVVEQKHQEQVQQIQEHQQDEYQAVRAQGPQAVESWLRDFDKRVP